MRRGRGTWISAGLVIVAVSVAGILYFRASTTESVVRERARLQAERATAPVSLYFGHPAREDLVAEAREVLYDPETGALLRRIVNELLRGSYRGNVDLFRQGTQLRALHLGADGELVLDFDGDPFPSESSEIGCRLALRSLLRVLDEQFPDVRHVALLIDGQPLSEMGACVAAPDRIPPSSWVAG
jgi:spore germination protein GerM